MTEDRIFLLDVTVQPPQWIEECCLVAPDNCTFSGQILYTPNSQRILAHARSPWDNVGQEGNLNTVQIWDAHNNLLLATKGFNDLVGSVGVSVRMESFVVVIQGDESDIFRSLTARMVYSCHGRLQSLSRYWGRGRR